MATVGKAQHPLRINLYRAPAEDNLRPDDLVELFRAEGVEPSVRQVNPITHEQWSLGVSLAAPVLGVREYRRPDILTSNRVSATHPLTRRSRTSGNAQLREGPSPATPLKPFVAASEGVDSRRGVGKGPKKTTSSRCRLLTCHHPLCQ
jgi:hypothetical protein